MEEINRFKEVAQLVADIVLHGFEVAG